MEIESSNWIVWPEPMETVSGMPLGKQPLVFYVGTLSDIVNTFREIKLIVTTLKKVEEPLDS